MPAIIIEILQIFEALFSRYLTFHSKETVDLLGLILELK